MYKIYESIPIEIWKKIAEQSQFLDINNGTEEEFSDNLLKFRRLLIKSGIDIEVLSRYPTKENRIGLASLLQAIYDIKTIEHYKKANFYEIICMIHDLQIKSIKFRPICSYDNVYKQIESVKCADKDITLTSKIYTDGNFAMKTDLKSNVKINYITNLKKANYLLNVKLAKANFYDHEIIKKIDSEIIIKKFDFYLPSNNEINNISVPKMKPQNKYYNSYNDSLYEQYKFLYETFNILDVSCRESLTHTEDFQYYYKSK